MVLFKRLSVPISHWSNSSSYLSYWLRCCCMWNMTVDWSLHWCIMSQQWRHTAMRRLMLDFDMFKDKKQYQSILSPTIFETSWLVNWVIRFEIACSWTQHVHMLSVFISNISFLWLMICVLSVLNLQNCRYLHELIFS